MLQNLKPTLTLLLRLIALFIAYYLVFCLVSVFYPLPLNIEYSPTVVSEEGNLLHGFLTSDDKWRMFTEIEEITPELQKAIVFKEDKYFFYHFGINPVSIVRAFLNNTREGYRTSGASTISMQVARLLEPKERTYKHKLFEIFRALQLEHQLSKDEILQLYLNLVPYGSNIEGVKSAAVIYFGKMPNHLSLAEISALSIIPNRPVSLRLGINNDYILEERNKWLDRYDRAGLFNSEYLADAKSEPLNAYRRSVPRLAPHLSYRLKSSYPGKSIISASINLETQRTCEQLVKEYSNRQYFQGIRNAMALVVNNEDKSVAAYVGSADFNNSEDGGQVDGIRAVRSPGSTLKPLLYGLAMDQGLITPKHMIADVPVSFAGYEPENYNEKFNGNISIETALAQSLNVPAVKIIHELKPSALIDALIDADFRQIRKEKNDLGLSMILGGCGVSMEELVGLYAALANQGEFQALRFLNNDKSAEAKALLTPSATFMITEIMTQLNRPDLPLAWSNTRNTPKIAWKTGTSYGRRDAWSIGYNRKFTIGVWVGNFSGEGVPDLSGAEKATPLLFQLFNALDQNPEEMWFMAPDSLQLRYVCSHTGKVPGQYCEDLIIDYYIPGVSDTRECDHLRKVFINPDSTISYCSACIPELGFKEALYPNYEPELLSYYQEYTIPYRKIPAHNAKCDRLLSGMPPEIISPVGETEYYVNVVDSMQIMLSCHVAADVEQVYWYIDKNYFGSCKAHQNLFFTPKQGKVEVSCTDDKGRSAKATIYVKHTGF